MVFLNDYVQWLQAENRYSEHTITAYKNDLSQFAKYIKQEYELDDMRQVNPPIIKSWIVHLLDMKVKAASVNRKKVSVSSFFNYLVRENLVEHNPAKFVKSPKKEKRLVKFATESQMRKLLNSETETGEYDFQHLRDKLIIELLYGTGIRLSEFTNLNVGDVLLEENLIKVTGKRKKQRLVPVHKQLSNILTDYLKIRESAEPGETALVLTDAGKRAYPMYVYRKLKEKLGNFTTLEKRSPHLLRHTFATHLLNNGADINAIKELLGHSSLAATQVYTHNSIERLKNIYNQAHPKAKKTNDNESRI